MAEEKTQFDAVRLYRTGPPTEGGPQIYPNESLGGGISSTEEYSFVVHHSGSLQGITVDYVSESNAPDLTYGTAVGGVQALDADTLVWIPPGGSSGVGVPIANGETKILYGRATGISDGRYVRVTRTSAPPLVGSLSVTMRRVWNNALSHADVPDSGSIVTYRCFTIKNEGPTNVTLVKIVLDNAYSDEEIRRSIAISPSEPPEDISILGEEHEPSTGGFDSAPIVKTISGSLAPGETASFWIERDVDSFVSVTHGSLPFGVILRWTDSDGKVIDKQIGGYFRVANDLDRYRLYHGQDALPDLTSFPAATSPTLPFDYPAGTLATSTKHYFILREMNDYGVETLVVDPWIFDLDGAGVEIAVSPTGPSFQSITPAASGIMNVKAVYDVEDDPADTFLIYLSNDGLGNPLGETPISVPMTGAGPWRLDYDSVTQADGAVIEVVVRTKRASDSGTSTNTAISTATASTTGPESPDPGCQWVQTETNVTRIWTHDASNYIDLVDGVGVFRITLGGSVVGGISKYRGVEANGSFIELPYSSQPTQSSFLEVDGGDGALGFGVDSDGLGVTYNRVAEISTTGDFRIHGLFVERPEYPVAQVDVLNIDADQTAVWFNYDLANMVMDILAAGTMRAKGYKENG